MNKNLKCKKCKQKMVPWEYSWNDGLCDDCKREITKKQKTKKILICAILGLLVFLVFAVIAYPLALVDYNFNVYKCNNLDSDFSSYGFDKSIDLNAEYPEKCYEILNYPLYKFYNVEMVSFMAGIFGFVFFSMIYFFYTTVKELGGS